MDDTKPAGSRRLDLAWLVLWGALASLYCVVAAQKLGATYDEPFYVINGMQHWRTGSYYGLLRAGTMPLPVDVQTLPLYLYETWQGVTLDVDGGLDAILPYARLGTLVFLWLMLIYGLLIGRALGGPWGGRLAVAFLAVEPSFLGHAGLATTDIAATACLLGFVYHYWKNRENERWLWRVGLPSVWFGFALLAKASAMVYGPVCMLVIECHRLHQKGAFHLDGPAGWWRRVRHCLGALSPWWRQTWAIGGLALAVVFVYCGSDWQQERTFVAWAQALPEGAFRDVMLWLAENLRIFPNAGHGLVRQVKHNVQGHFAYLVGLEDRRAIWFYFPVLLIIKLTLPVLVLTVLLLVSRPRALGNWAFLCFAVLIGVSLTFRVQLGIRMILPMVALGIIGLAAGLVNTLKDLGYSWRGVALRLLATAGLAWMAAGTSRQHPHGLCYTNELWGNTREGYRFVSDANYDWGQGLKELRRWQDKHQIDELDVWYFGADPLARKLPMRFTNFTELKLKTEQEFLDRVRGRYLAVGTTHLYGSCWEGAEVPRQVLRKRKAVARVQTFLIYDFREEEKLVRKE